MHPVIKIILFLILAAAVTFGDVAIRVAGGVLLLVLYLSGPGEWLRIALRMLKRMRWFFLSIAVVYLFFTPGRLLFSFWPWGPTWESLSEGGQRIVSLVFIVLAVNLLLRSTQRPDLISAILWCLLPLAWVGLPRERLAVRIALTLDAIDLVQVIYRHRPYDGRYSENVENTQSTVEELRETRGFSGLKERVWRIAATAQRLVLAVIEQAEAAPVQRIEVPRPSHPPMIQWLYPLLLIAVFVGLNG